MAYFLGIDLGASGLKACLIDMAGKVSALARVPLDTYHPAPGHAEQKPADWHAALHAALAQLAQNHSRAFDQVAAISLSGGAHIGVLCDSAARPLANAIMWSDQRAAPQAAALVVDASENGAQIESVTGNHPNATWTLPQLLWLKEHKPELVAATQKLFFAKDWLAYQLTDMHITDPTEAVGSLMADRQGNWQADLQALSGLSPTAFPQIVAPMTKIGALTPGAASAYGLKAGIAVYQGAIDTSLEWLCAAPQSRDMASLKLASAGVLAFTTDKATAFPPVSFYPHIIGGLSYHAAGMSDCMGAIDWVRQSLTPHIDAAAFAAAAARAAPGADGLVFYPYLSGARAPFWDADLRAELRGLTRAHGVDAIARAAFEGVGHVLNAIWHDMTDRLGHRPDTLNVLGGGGRHDFFCQMLADMLGVTLLRARQTDSAFAAALLAATAHGAFADMAAAATAGHEMAGQFVPDSAGQARYAQMHEIFMARHRASGAPKETDDGKPD